jgi:hypothetical protein
MRSGLGPRLLSYSRRAAIASAALVALLTGAGLASSAQAATYTVGTHSDTARGVPCELGPASGTCSLRQLIEYENALPETPKPPDVIAVPSGRYELLYGTLTITQSLVIEGAGARTTTVDISPDGYEERVFNAQSPAESAIGIIGLEIAGGTTDPDADEEYPGFGGDIRNKGSLLLSEDWVTEGAASAGGGIANVAGTLVLERSLVSSNHASAGGGEGGGIENYGSEECIDTCGPGKKAVSAVEDSTVAGNEAALGAGVLSATEDGVADENGVTIINSTIAYNSTQGEPGAGLLAYDGTIDVVGSIVAYNSATTDGLTAYTNCRATSPAKIASIGYNLETGTDCGFKSTGDKQSTAPDFSSSTPQNNGGNTDTLAPEPTSPAVNAIPTSWEFCDGTDQRGVTRPQGAGCDIGAVELGGAVTPPVEKTPTPSPAPPTLVTTSPPTVLSTTSAAFTTTVNPEGLATEVHFEYGPVLPGAKTTAITYGSVTSDQSVGSDFANHTVTAMVTGLLPNVTYNVRAVATNSAGSAVGANQTLVTPADPPPPPPVLGKAVNVTPVSGIVYIKLPPGATLASAASVSPVSPFAPFALGAQAFEALTKGQAFIPLTEARQIPVGSILETTGGVVGITTATTASRKGKLQSGNFGAGIFKLLQSRKQKGLTELDMIDNRSARQVCATIGKGKGKGKGKGGAYAAKHLSSKTLGRINASAHGRFTVRGQYSAATVRGTVWNVGNRCEGTLTHVTRGVVSVRDFRRRKTITLFTGQSYLARGPVKRP